MIYIDGFLLPHKKRIYGPKGPFYRTVKNMVVTLMNKLFLLIVFAVFSLTLHAKDKNVEDLNAFMMEKFDLDVELLSWLILKGKSNSTKSRELWDRTGGVPWQIKELEKKGYVYIIIREYPEYNDQIGYSTSITKKAAPILEAMKEPEKFDEISMLKNFERESRIKNTIYISPVAESKLLQINDR